MSTRSEQREGSLAAKEDLKEDISSMTSEMSRMSFEPKRYSVDQSINLDRKVIGYKMRTVSEPRIVHQSKPEPDWIRPKTN